MSSADRVSECSSQVGSDDGKNGDLTISRTKTASSEASDRKEYDGEGPAYRYPTQDRSELRRLASVWSGVPSRHATTEELQRQETVTGILPSDPRLNPNDPAFDFHLWARVLSRTLEREGVRRPRAGFTFKNLNVSGIGAGLQLQKSVGSVLMTPFGFKSIWRQRHASEKLILKDFHGAVRSGEMLIVLGRPGSGCTTFLKSVCGQLHGLKKSPASVIHYNGIPQDLYVKEFRGEIVYNEENEKHFPHLTVGQTLRFAAAARTPSNRVHDIPRLEFSKYATQIAMNLFGLSHVENTKVGDDFIRGVSGGERKRVSIAEMAVSGAPIAAWDNATRGLDAATALDFVRASKVSSQIWGTTHAVAIYQASQSIYDVFDKAMVLYEGREIYFGPAQKARAYFENMGWSCPQRQTTGDFLTSVTNPHERQARPGFEERVPRTPDEFENYWHQSAEYKVCLDDIQRVEAEYPIGGSTLDEFRTSHRRTQAKHTRPTSPYRISIPMQVRLCVTRAYQRMWNDKASVLTRIIGQTIQALIIGSIYYGTPSSTSGFFSTGALLFFAILLNALMSVSEINTLYKQRPIVEKHKSFALYHPFTEALAGFIADVPVKLVGSTMFNLVLYFLGGLRYEPGPFFIFFLFTFVAMLTMSTIFRTIAASTKAVTQAMGIAGVMILAIVIYTGFTLQKSYMHPWFKWINYINPVGYAYEALLVNEIHGRYFPCSPTSLVPPYGTGENFRCAVAGSVPGELDVSGDAWMNSSYGYRYSHLWRNLGFMFAFMIFFFVLYLLISELNSTPTSTAEFLVYRRGHVPKHLQHPIDDIEASGTSCSKNKEITPDEGSGRDVKPLASLPPQKDIFTWQDVTLDIPVKDGQRRLLDHVSGWVKPGTLTALMGVSGAGKTTLLDALAQRIKIGVLTGDMLVNGRPLDASFQRKTGYVQQQDLHLETATVREALRFSAMLRQPQSVPVKEKYESVEEVIKMLNMEDFSEAIIGVPGEGDDPPAKAGYILIDLGLNIEQRKLLTIGVELAARPALLLFLDEPTSGLDSQSSWTIITLLRRLADSGQAVLSTIHQPSAMLFQQFDRLLFLAKGGKTVYFGDIGANSRTLLDYFETAGARRCDDKENPAEYMLEIVGVGSHHKTEIDWAEVWNTSQQSRGVQAELDRISALSAAAGDTAPEVVSTSKFALPLALQTYHVTKRVFQQYWRTPQYVMGKFMLCTMSALFVGFSFYKQNSSQTGMQNTIFAIFMVTTIFTPLVQQVSLTWKVMDERHDLF